MNKIIIRQFDFKKRCVLVLTLAIVVSAFLCYSAKAVNIGDKLGNVLNTDIKVYIDGIEIAGYNIDGLTYIVAEDLRPYGFKVDWNGTNRSLSISKGKASGSFKSIPKNTNRVGSVAFPYVYTDITTHINGTKVKSYNIQGNTVIKIDDLANEFGKLTWNGVKREIYVSIVIPIESITLDMSNTTINRSNSQKLNHTVYPADTTESVSYTSSDEKVATVSKDGVVRALSTGMALGLALELDSYGRITSGAIWASGY